MDCDQNENMKWFLFTVVVVVVVVFVYVYARCVPAYIYIFSVMTMLHPSPRAVREIRIFFCDAMGGWYHPGTLTKYACYIT